MSPYVAIVAARFRALLQYRGAALGGIVSQGFFGLVRIMILEGFYRSAVTPPPLDFHQAVDYVWMGQATLALFAWNTDPEIRDQIRAGTVVYELCRPLDLYTLWYVRAAAWRSAPTLLRALPIVVFAGVILPAVGLGDWALRPPVSVGAGLGWVVAIGGALLVSAALTTLSHIALLWSLGADGVTTLIFSIATICGGLTIPLPLFPDWAQTVLAILPFSGMLDLPARLYTGNVAASAIAWILLHQLGWTAILAAVGRRLLGRETRRLVVQGG